MSSAHNPLVRPRIVSPISGETLPLIDVVRQELFRGTRVIQISGGPGSGKSSALAYLAKELEEAGDIAFMDDATWSEVTQRAHTNSVVCTGRIGFHDAARVVLPLAPWTDDELIEYLTAAAPEHCGSVMRRLASVWARDELRGNPALWCGVLAQFVADEDLCSIRAAIQRLLNGLLRDHRERRFAADFCIAILIGDDAETTRTLGYLAKGPADYQRLRLLRHPFVQRMLAGERIAKLILSEGECPALTRRWPQPLIDELTWLAQCDSVLAERLHALYASDRRSYHPQVATLLFALDKSWRPHANRQAHLAGGSFREAAWSGVVLPSIETARSDLSDADLARANLENSRLDRAVAKGAQLECARLNKASLRNMNATAANLAGAQLVAALADGMKLSEADLTNAVFDDASLIGAFFSGANLTGASFRQADLSFADFANCLIDDTDFSGANLRNCDLKGLVVRNAILENASFQAAVLVGCDLEAVQLPAADFRRAKLRHALLTGSYMPHADFCGADLRGAGLADIQWEDTNLRDADLSGCTFHMGSTRSGLVGSPYPGHGSKTGFYTDDYHDQGFKRPEEIRKANLCGADLRGARLDDVDFYLVDLRDALLDDDALEQVVRTGGILYDRCT